MTGEIIMFSLLCTLILYLTEVWPWADKGLITVGKL